MYTKDKTLKKFKDTVIYRVMSISKSTNNSTTFFSYLNTLKITMILNINIIIIIYFTYLYDLNEN